MDNQEFINRASSFERRNSSGSSVNVIAAHDIAEDRFDEQPSPDGGLQHDYVLLEVQSDAPSEIYHNTLCSRTLRFLGIFPSFGWKEVVVQIFFSLLSAYELGKTFYHFSEKALDYWDITDNATQKNFDSIGVMTGVCIGFLAAMRGIGKGFRLSDTYGPAVRHLSESVKHLRNRVTALEGSNTRLQQRLAAFERHH